MRNNLREQIKNELQIIKNKEKGYKELENKYFQVFYELTLYDYMRYKLLLVSDIKDNILKIFFKVTDKELFKLREETLDKIEDYFLLNKQCA
ncbi:MAG: hypothetical protein IJX17_05760 [Clostridia bacterium]|nr:hypothetical protein [Clostridia bacterium]